MAAPDHATQSGSGTRPSTDGTVDNLGAGESFSREKPNAASPGPSERMGAKRADADSVEDDGSAPFGLTESAKSIRSDRNEDPGGQSDRDR